jgi:hypothetical protein
MSDIEFIPGKRSTMVAWGNGFTPVCFMMVDLLQPPVWFKWPLNPTTTQFIYPSVNAPDFL